MIVWFTILAFATVFGVTINFFVSVNGYNLTYGFYIVFLPIDKLGYSFNWLLNYFYQVLICLGAGTFCAFYFLLMYIFFSHTAYQVDASILHAQGMNSVLESSRIKISSPSIKCNNRNPAESHLALANRLLVKARLESIVEKTKNIQKWQHDVQGLLQITFMVEFVFMGFILCFLLFSFIGSDSRSVMVIILPFVALPRLFIYCFMGTRMMMKIDNLSAELYASDWHLMDTKQQKDWQMIVMMSQNMREFNGIFMPVNLATFKEVKLNFCINDDLQKETHSTGFEVLLLLTCGSAINKLISLWCENFNPVLGNVHICYVHSPILRCKWIMDVP